MSVSMAPCHEGAVWPPLFGLLMPKAHQSNVERVSSSMGLSAKSRVDCLSESASSNDTPPFLAASGKLEDGSASALRLAKAATMAATERKTRLDMPVIVRISLSFNPVLTEDKLLATANAEARRAMRSGSQLR